MGDLGSWLRRYGLHSYSVCTALLWTVDPEEESLLSAVAGDGYDEGWEWDEDA